jgi:tetratricopeptide (TPR) repeat protein
MRSNTMRQRCLCLLSCAALLLAAACDRASDAAPVSSAPAAGASSAVMSVSSAQAKALEPPKGATPVDGQIVALQAKVQKPAAALDDWILLGRQWIKKARAENNHDIYHHAEACARVVLDVDANNLLAKNLIGTVMLEEHRFEDARNIAQEILGEYPGDIPALGTLSDAFLELGRYDESISAADKMNDLKPSLPAYGRAAYLQWLRGDVDGALASFHAAAEAGRDPTDPEPRAWALVQAAHIFWHKGDYQGARAGYALVTKEMPSNAAALAGSGRVAQALGDPKHAADLLASAFAKHPLLETAWRLGDARAAAGDSAGAEEAYDKVVLGKETDKRTAAQFLATKNRDTETAIRLAKEELEVRPGVYTWDAYAWALYRARRFPEAKEAADKASRLGTPDPALLYHAGAIQIALGDVDAGKKLVRRALELNPHFDETGAPEAQKLLDETP